MYRLFCSGVPALKFMRNFVDSSKCVLTVPMAYELGCVATPIKKWVR